MPPISSGDVLIGASVSRTTRKRLCCSSCSAHRHLCSSFAPSARCATKGRNGMREKRAWGRSVAAQFCRGEPAHRRGSVLRCGCGVSQGVPAYSRVSQRTPGCRSAPLPASRRARRCRRPHGGPGAGKAAALPGDGGVAAGSAGLRWPRWLRCAPGRAIALKRPFHRCPGPPRPGAGARC